MNSDKPWKKKMQAEEENDHICISERSFQCWGWGWEWEVIEAGSSGSLLHVRGRGREGLGAEIKINLSTVIIRASDSPPLLLNKGMYV